MSELIEILQQPLDFPSFICGVIGGLMLSVFLGMFISINKDGNNE